MREGYHLCSFAQYHPGFPGGTSGKEPACQCRRLKRPSFNPWVRKTPWRRKWQPTPVFLSGESHGQRSLVGYSPWHSKESDTTEKLSIHILVLALNVPYSHPKETWMVDQPIQRFESRQSNVQMVFLNPPCTFHFNHCHLGGEVWYDMISITHDWSKPILYYPVVQFITDPMKLHFASKEWKLWLGLMKGCAKLCCPTMAYWWIWISVT